MAFSPISDSIPRTDKRDLLDKLKRIEGRVKGIMKMVEDDRHVEDVMIQFTATYEAMRVAMKILIKKHMEDSIAKGLISTNSDKRNETYDKLLSDIFKYVR
jgi:DNA-binding FrmR family transcriptional regulator